jgi:predicted DNA binding protein
MIEAQIQVSSEGYYSCEITRTLPVRVFLVAINGPVGLGLIEALDKKEITLQRYVRYMRNSKSILSFEITHASPSLYWTRARHELMGQSIHETILESDCMTRLPIIIQKGHQNHTVLAPSQEAFRTMYDSLVERFTKVRIRKISRSPTEQYLPRLTTKQAAAFRTAFEAGYYDIPRTTTLEKLSTPLGIGRVALQERLRRAERAILSQYADMYL